MSEENKVEVAKTPKTRRAIVTTAAQVAVTLPAVGLLLSASTKPAKAAHLPYDDPGNFAENIDSAVNHTTTKDDVFP